ncbi:ABC transporter permease [Microvirga splendida]|uniref:ABC transporter permease subunit n=1 Tax=Microvirga splendida TaxID=2795727 RepID=A0ABS0Y2B4_9HYPH|nr:ABC transporter permease subunit [Microvirga splendida]MBJ6126441.1 ABC transporter permease subunit [Microvirga splendida]
MASHVTPAPKRGNPVRLILPLAVFAAALAAWEGYVRLNGVPPYILPAPSLIATTIVTDWPLLRASLFTTLQTTLLGLVLAVLGGVFLAVLLSLSRIVEYSLYPFAIVLQVTPVIAIAPLLLIYMPQDAAVLTCAWLVAFFPVLSNTMLGLQSVDRNLMELFGLYGAPAANRPLARFRSRLKALWYLRRPAALSAFLTGLRIAGGLSLIGAVVAEMAAGSAGAGSGLAYRIIESQYRLNIPRLFAALVLLALTGIVLYLLLAGISHLLLRRWHESALSRDA